MIILDDKNKEVALKGILDIAKAGYVRFSQSKEYRALYEAMSLTPRHFGGRHMEILFWIAFNMGRFFEQDAPNRKVASQKEVKEKAKTSAKAKAFVAKSEALGSTDGSSD